MNPALRNQLLGGAFCFWMAWGATGAVPDKYQTILDRNPFGLQPPPQPVETPVVEPPVEVKVTGFARIGGVDYVYFAVPEKGKKDQYKFLSLRSGQSEGDLQVVEISSVFDQVQVKNSGVAMALNLQKHGFQTGKGPAGAVPQPTSPVVAQAPVSPVYNPGVISAQPVQQEVSQPTAFPQSGPVAMNPPRQSGGYAASGFGGRNSEMASFSGGSGHVAGGLNVGTGRPSSGYTYDPAAPSHNVTPASPPRETPVAKPPWVPRQITYPPLPGGI